MVFTTRRKLCLLSSSNNGRDKPAFITKYGLFQFVRMSFGLCNAHITCMRVTHLVLRGLHWDIVLAFLDDMVVLGKGFQNHIDNLRSVLDRFRHNGLTLKLSKCQLFQRKVEVLGREVDGNGMQIGRSYVNVIEDWSVLVTSKQVEQYLGFILRSLNNYANIARPMHSITGKQAFGWEPEQHKFLDLSRQALYATPVLAFSNATDNFIFDTDASNFVIGGELLQVQNGVERVIANGSFVLSMEQLNYCTTHKELLAVVRFTRQSLFTRM